MKNVWTWAELKASVERLNVIEAMERAFTAYSNGECVIPPVGELQFEDPPGDVHIKYGYIRSGTQYVVKIASGFYNNPALGLPSSQGLMLLFSQRTGTLDAVLLDEGNLTDIRTAAAGALTIQRLAPATADAIGILGTGTQARHQLVQLKHIHPSRRLYVWGRNQQNAERYASFAKDQGFDTIIASDPKEVADNARVIITTTPATSPLLRAEWIAPGTHITAVGSDTPHKQELSSDLLAKANRIVVDSIAQSESRGEVFRARSHPAFKPERIIELGHLLQNPELGRQNDTQITIADLTGVAVQDLVIAQAVHQALTSGG